MIDIDKTLFKLATVISLSEQEEITIADWQRFCIVSRIGVDHRTHDTWLQVCVMEGLLRPKRGSGKKTTVWSVESAVLSRILGGQR